MSAENIQNELKQRFEAELPEFYKRRIIFWQDEDKEFEADFDEIEIPNVKKYKRTSTNNFVLKKLLLHDDLKNNYLIYNPLTFNNNSEDWLRDIILYSEEYRADAISMTMAEMNIESSAIMRTTTKEYKNFFNNKERKNQLLSLNRIYK